MESPTGGKAPLANCDLRASLVPFLQTAVPTWLLETRGCSPLDRAPGRGGPPGPAHLDVQVCSRVNQHLDHGFVPGSAGVHQRRQTLRESEGDAEPSASRRNDTYSRGRGPTHHSRVSCWTRLPTLSRPVSWLDLLPLPGPLDTPHVYKPGRAPVGWVGGRAQAWVQPLLQDAVNVVQGTCLALCLSFFFKMRLATVPSSRGCCEEHELLCAKCPVQRKPTSGADWSQEHCEPVAAPGHAATS